MTFFYVAQLLNHIMLDASHFTYSTFHLSILPSSYFGTRRYKQADIHLAYDIF